MKNMSLTQGGVILAVAGTLIMGLGFSETCTNEITTYVPTILGGIMAWIGRYRHGDVNILGIKK